MTQTEFARRLNITKSVVSNYELQERTPSPDVLIQLSHIFHVSTDYLLGIDHKKMIDVTGLNDEDVRFLLITIETLRKKNNKELGFFVSMQNKVLIFFHKQSHINKS